ncbi:MAG TPA: universal stress protein [Streptosporangiaceae bacterium]|nr:universal stress protein [Streptosporangiaceae bacterium]
MTQQPAGHRARIVVGVDGSAESVEALRWAARQAELTGSELRVLTAWEYPSFYGWAPANPGQTDFAHLAGQAQQDALGKVFGADPPDWVQAQVTEGPTARALVDAAADADLLVVGSRGHGGLADAVLGSVSTYCVHHARGPVTIVRPG